jgi:hypothetical protein
MINMRYLRLLMVALVISLLAITNLVLPQVVRASTSIDVSVASEYDDGYISANGTNFDYYSNNMFCGTLADGIDATLWVRFISITIPAGANITVATITFQEVENNSSPLLMKVWGVDADNATAPANYSDVDNATLTTVGVEWDGDWATPNATSPSLVPIVSELLASYTLNNSVLMFQIRNNGSTGVYRYHAADTWNKGDHSYAATLHIEYNAVSAPTVVTNATTSVEETTATASGNITATSENCTEIYFQYDTDTDEPYSSNVTYDEGGYTTGNITFPLTGLIKGDEYFGRAGALNSGGVGWGEEVSWIMKPDPATSFTSTNNGSSWLTFSWTNGAGMDSVTLQYSDDDYPATINDGELGYNGAGTSCNVTGLSSNTTYYARLFTQASEGGLTSTADSNPTATDKTDILVLSAPTVTAEEVTTYNDTWALVTGEITDTGGENCTSWGTQWGLLSGGVYTDDITHTGNKGLGSWSDNVTGLTPGTAYIYRTFATNPEGTGYSDEGTYAVTPTISTSAASGVGETGAILNGGVTDTGGQSPTVTVYWGDNDGGTTPGNWDYSSAPTSPSQPQGAIAFYKDITGLSLNTTYYFTARATNAAGTDWATTQSFTTRASIIDESLYDGVISISNNGTLANDVSVNMTLDSQSLMDVYGVDDDFDEIAIRNSAGAAVPFMPGYNGSPWYLWVPEIAANGSFDYTLYLSQSSLNATKYYFPGDGGMTISDNGSMVLADDFSVTYSGYVDTTDVGSNLVYKPDAFRMYVNSSRNIVAEIYGGGSSVWTSPTGHSGNWTNPTNAYDDNTDTYTYYSTIRGWWSQYEELTLDAPIYADRIRFNAAQDYAPGYPVYLWVDIYNYDTSSWVNIYEAEPPDHTWVTQNFTATTVSKARFRMFNITGQDPWDTKLYEFDFGEILPLAVTASDLDNGEYKITAYADTDNFIIEVNDEVADTIALDGAEVLANNNDWVIGSTATPYIEYFSIDIAGDNECYIEWGYPDSGGTFEDGTGSAEGSPIPLISGNYEITIESDGTFAVGMPYGLGAIVTSGTANVTGSPITIRPSSSHDVILSAIIDVTGTGYINVDVFPVFIDKSGNHNYATPTFRTESSDSDVTAVLINFAPITTAIPPGYTVDNAPAFITANITVAGQFTTGDISGGTGGPPGFALISDLADQGKVPRIWAFGIIAICLVSAGQLFWIWMQRRYGFRSMWPMFATGLLIMGLFVALGGTTKIFDFWMVVFYIIIFVSLMVMSRHTELGGNVSTHGMIGFAAQSWIGLTLINKMLEGTFIGASETAWANTYAFTQNFKLFNLFSLPVLNLDFWTKGIPSLLKWDYSFFGGNAQLFQYLLYSLTAVIAFIIFGLLIGLLYNFFKGI